MQKTKELIKQINKKNKGITLIALVITIIVLIILARISISLILGQNGLFNKAKSAATETAKARFLEDAGFAYSEAYIEKVETSNANDITIGAVVEKLKSSYGYTDEQIVTVTSGVSGITLSDYEVTLEPGQTKDVTVELENGTYYALIEGLYYPITLSNGEVALGEGIKNLPVGEEEEKTFEVKVTEGSEKVEVIKEEAKITIKVKLRT